MFEDNNDDRYREKKILNYNEVLVWKIAEVESNDKVR
jgi:hypothetical protein